jgi:predicted methyltransferase MtxX (methanogen marker protein 4)
LTYTALGNNAYQKEYCQIYFDGKIIVINDYKELQGIDIKVEKTKTDYPSKGLFEELVEFGNYMNGKIKIPIPLRQLQEATEICFKLRVGL